MNTNTKVITGGVIAVLVVAGLVFYASQTTPSPSPSTVSTSADVSGNTGTPAEQTPAAQPSMPAATTNPVSTPFGTAAVVTGTVVPNGALTSYWYEYGTTANLGSKTPSQIIGSGYGAIPAPSYMLNLAKDTTYYFRLIAQNQFGTTMGLAYSLRTVVGTPLPVGSIPTIKTLAATGISRTAAALAGQVNPNKVSTQYWFEYGQSRDLGNASALQSVGDGSATMSASLALSNLTPATTYYFRLNAQNQFGTVNGTVLSFKTSSPPASSVPVVTTQLASPFATTTATLLGTVNPYGTQTTYWFEYSTDANFGSTLLKTTSQRSAGAGATTVSVTANITNLKASTTYYYRVVAQNTAGTVRGNSQSVTTK